MQWLMVFLHSAVSLDCHQAESIVRGTMKPISQSVENGLHLGLALFWKTLYSPASLCGCSFRCWLEKLLEGSIRMGGQKERNTHITGAAGDLGTGSASKLKSLYLVRRYFFKKKKRSKPGATFSSNSFVVAIFISLVCSVPSAFDLWQQSVRNQKPHSDLHVPV